MPASFTGHRYSAGNLVQHSFPGDGEKCTIIKPVLDPSDPMYLEVKKFYKETYDISFEDAITSWGKHHQDPVYILKAEWGTTVVYESSIEDYKEN